MIDEEISRRLRAHREMQQISIRELARRVGMSPSAISQIETGRTSPSVATLYAIVSELRISLDELFGHVVKQRPAGEDEASRTVVRRADRAGIDLGAGVRWERLTPAWDGEVDFVFVRYEAGGASTPEGELIRHAGRQYGLVLTGRLRVVVGFERYELEAGDSVAFDSSSPHRLDNPGDEPMTGVWLTIGRRERSPQNRAWPASVEWGSAF
jgi:transcriptional regulator with XRE-family HTH domain